MNRHLTEREINDYVDGLLPARERAAAGEHLSACAACRSAEAGIRGLVQRLRGLPAGIAPPRDLRPAVAARRRAGRRRVAAAVLAAAAAVVFGVLVSVPGAGPAGGAPASTAVLEEFRSAEARYASAAAELQAELADRRAELSPEAADLLRRNLGTVDRALREGRAALRENPDDADLARMTLALYERKLDVLRGTLESTGS